MLRLILIFLVIYVFYKAFKYIIRIIVISNQKSGRDGNIYDSRPPRESKFKDIEEAKYTEIETKPRESDSRNQQ